MVRFNTSSSSVVAVALLLAACGSTITVSPDTFTGETVFGFDKSPQDQGNADESSPDADIAGDQLEEVAPCVSQCGKECCTAGQICMVDGTCCTPNCNDKCMGGTDGCGNACPTTPECTGCCTDDKVCKPGTFNEFCGKSGLACQQCTGAMSCQNSMCSNEVCTPNCEGKCAGVPDGCGGVCPEGSCTGCCKQENGTKVCLPGNTAAACGKNGAECDVCDGTLCTGGLCGCEPNCAGKCQGADNGCGGICSVNSCEGCCTADKKCEPGLATSACGKVGGACAVCGPDQNCTERTCTDKPCEPSCTGKQCGPNGCGGTCGTCASPAVCTSTGACCTPQCAGKCHTADDGCGGKCSQNDACVGCCAADGMCQAGTTLTFCGKSGGACDACTGTEVCQNGICQEPCVPDCTNKCPTADDGCGGICSANPVCEGCCDVNGICQAGSSAVACGKSGGACKVCVAGEQCVNQVCLTVCTPNCSNKCPNAPDGCGGVCSSNPACPGCCSNGFCMPGTWTDLCGKSGQECKACLAPQTCENMVCTQNCVPSCTLKCNGESDGCGGYCPTCDAGYLCVSGVCEVDDTGTTCSANANSRPSAGAALLVLMALVSLAAWRRRS